MLDPGGFGTVTITKSIILDGSTGAIGGILFSATNGININAGPDDVVVLRNLSLTGSGTTLGLNGVNVIKAGKVFIDNVKIQTASQNGINVVDGAGATVFVNGAALVNVASASATPASIDNAAIHVQDAASVVYLSNSTLFGNHKAFSTARDGSGGANSAPSGGRIISFNNNRLEGNASNSAPTETLYER